MTDYGLPDDDPEPITPEEVRRLAQQKTKRALEILLEIAENDDAPPQSRIAACNSIVNIAWKEEGEKPTGNTTYNTQIINVTEQVLRAIPQDKLLELRAKVNGSLQS